jgi:glyoxylase-like metal-dependent hydrolase (beta-lactamase superfamily II)
VINLGDILLPLAEHMNLPADAGSALPELRDLSGQQFIPIHNILVQMPEATVLVDAGFHDVVGNPEYAIPGYAPPPGLVDQLATLGVAPEGVSHLVITHRHWDHFNGTTQQIGGRIVPAFPRARHFLGRPDWLRAESALADPCSLESRTLGVLQREGLLELVEGDVEIAAGIGIIAAPGETPGHQVVRVHSDGATLYCLGDLYHHPLEFARPDTMVSWAGRDPSIQSRSALMPRFQADHGLLVGTHLRDIGRICAKDGAFAWESVKPTPVLPVLQNSHTS